jgi:mannose-6-phosphate isomerase-like protein (cupin superfamily)
MRTIILTASIILESIAMAAPAGAQSPTNSLAPTTTTPIDLSAADIQAIMKLGENNPMKSLDAGEHVVFVWFESRKPGVEGGVMARREQPNGTLIQGSVTHANLTEIYYILQGSATLRTGGRITGNYRPDVLPTLLPGTNIVRFPIYSIRGDSEGGVSRKVKAGDLVVMPPGTVHTWGVVDGPMPLAYLNIRIDPEHRLSAGYTHPALRK